MYLVDSIMDYMGLGDQSCEAPETIVSPDLSYDFATKETIVLPYLFDFVTKKTPVAFFDIGASNSTDNIMDCITWKREGRALTNFNGNNTLRFNSDAKHAAIDSMVKEFNKLDDHNSMCSQKVAESIAEVISNLDKAFARQCKDHFFYGKQLDFKLRTTFIPGSDRLPRWHIDGTAIPSVVLLSSGPIHDPGSYYDIDIFKCDPWSLNGGARVFYERMRVTIAFKGESTPICSDATHELECSSIKNTENSGEYVVQAKPGQGALFHAHSYHAKLYHKDDPRALFLATVYCLV